MQDATSESVTPAHVDQGYSCEKAADAAQALGIRLQGVKLPEARC